MVSKLSNNGKYGSIQAMPLRKGKVNLTSGSYKIKIIYCASDGNITITWDDNTTDEIVLTEGNSFAIDGAKSIELNTSATSGIFHIV